MISLDWLLLVVGLSYLQRLYWSLSFSFSFYLCLFGALAGLVGAGDTTDGGTDSITITEGVWNTRRRRF
jgi:hypothetical protein